MDSTRTGMKINRKRPSIPPNSPLITKEKRFVPTIHPSKFEELPEYGLAEQAET
jgi:hypothetical protein